MISTAKKATSLGYNTALNDGSKATVSSGVINSLALISGAAYIAIAKVGNDHDAGFEDDMLHHTAEMADYSLDMIENVDCREMFLKPKLTKLSSVSLVCTAQIALYENCIGTKKFHGMNLVDEFVKV